MDQHELLGGVTYTHVALPWQKNVGRGLSLSRDRRSIVVIGQRQPWLGKNWRIGPLDKKKNRFVFFCRFLPHGDGVAISPAKH